MRQVAGIGHTRGTTADPPAQWLIDLAVADLDASVALDGIKRYVVIEDPAGAVVALFQESAEGGVSGV